MRFSRLFIRSLVLLVIAFTTGSWGFLVHRTINQLSIYELPGAMGPFFYKNMDYLVYQSPRPDLRRNTDPGEAPRHFIDLEQYGKDVPTSWDEAVNRYGMDSLKKAGFVPFHIMWMKDRLTAAFVSLNKDSILFYAADLGHYIADAVVPLHTTENYDGQLTNQKGLHSLWESMVPELEIQNYQLSSSHRAVYLKNPGKEIWKAVYAAYALVPGVLKKEWEVSANFTPEQKISCADAQWERKQELYYGIRKSLCSQPGKYGKSTIAGSHRFTCRLLVHLLGRCRQARSFCNYRKFYRSR